jgi:hypothetical protein
MDAVDLIVAAGVEAVDAGAADEHQILESRRDVLTRIPRCAIAHLRPDRSDRPEMTKATQGYLA